MAYGTNVIVTYGMRSLPYGIIIGGFTLRSNKESRGQGFPETGSSFYYDKRLCSNDFISALSIPLTSCVSSFAYNTHNYFS